MKKYFLHKVVLLLVILSLVFTQSGKAANLPNKKGFVVKDLADYVNTLIGTKGYGASGGTFLGPIMPFGSIYPGPDTAEGDSAGYRFDRPIRGFSQTHVSGTGGGGKYGNFLVSPQTGAINVGETEHDSEKADEVAKAYYYSVDLKRYGVKTEIAPTHNAAIYRFTFPKAKESSILIDLAHYIPSDLSDCYSKGYAVVQNVSIDVKNKKITGWGTYHGGWDSGRYNIYFTASFDKVPSAYGTWKNGKLTVNSTKDSVDVSAMTFDQIRTMDASKKNRIGAYFSFQTKKNEVIQMKIAVSMVSINNATAFLKTEIPTWNFDNVKATGKAEWNKALSTILLEGADDTQKTIFYSNLFRTMTMLHNRTGDNPWGSGEPYYDDQYCIWDTFRTEYPLLTILKESVVRDNIKSFIDRHKHNVATNNLPNTVMDAFIAGNEATGAQGGDDAGNVIADAYIKGVSGIDWEKAYKILKYQADNNRLDDYRNNDKGWLSTPTTDWQNTACSKTLEFAYNDFVTAQVAKGLGKLDDYNRYLVRSRGWENLWDPALKSDGFKGMIRGKAANGSWNQDFDPKKWYTWGGPYFYEGSAWTYSYFVPHDMERLINLMGGAATFTNRLKYAFDSHMIDLGNEPSFLATRLFDYAGRPDLTSYYTRNAIKNWTTNGYPGDEDAGAMSSFYIFSTLGFFPNAGQDLYLMNGPLFKKATIQMENGNKIILNGVNASEKNMYIQSATLNGKTFNKSWFTHEDLRKGAEFTFVMGPKPSDWGKTSIPPTVDTNKSMFQK